MDAAFRPLPTKHRASGRVANRRPKSSIVVLLNSKPRDYVPNSGPPLERIQLLPPKDTTAYIVERILLPPEDNAEDGLPLPKRMTYIVGWSDLPAARVLVPAMQILDYVSPRVLEEWETNLEQQLDDGRAKMGEEKLLEYSNAVPKRKRGRPPLHSQIESAAAAELDGDGTAQRLKGGAMAQTTPRKSRLKRFKNISDTDCSPSRQLERELLAQVDDINAGQDATIDYVEDSENEYPLMDDAIPGAEDPRFSDSIWKGTGGKQTTSLPGGPAKAAVDFERVISDSEDLSSDLNNVAMSRREAGYTASPRPKKRQRIQKDTPDTLLTGSSEIPAKATSHRSSQSTARQKTPQNGIKRSARGKVKPAKSEDESFEGADDSWIVQDIEGDTILEVEGRGMVRFFKVRWEGDWPEDQNPSWEPEENLPAPMIRNYFKRPLHKRQPKATIPKSQASRKQRMSPQRYKQTQLSWGESTQHSGVSTTASEDNFTEHSSNAGEANEEPAELFVGEEQRGSTAPMSRNFHGHDSKNGVTTANHGVAGSFGFR